jgi:hypothetical protein
MMTRLSLAVCALLFPVNALAAENILVPGVTLEVFDIGMPMDRLHPVDAAQKPNRAQHRFTVSFRNAEFGSEDFFVARVHGYLNVSVPGRYSFRLSSDDGSRMTLDSTELVNNDRLHPEESRYCDVELEKGMHRFDIEMFDNDGDAVLRLEWKPPYLATYVDIGIESLMTELELSAVSSGRKSLVPLGAPMRPGSMQPLRALHPGFRLVAIRPDWFQPKVGALAFLPSGKLLVATVDHPNPTGRLYLLDGVTGDHVDRAKVTVKEIASGLWEPMGLIVYRGRLFLAQKQEITELIDSDGDDIIDTYHRFAGGWLADNFHHFTFGLDLYGGNLYGALSTSIGGWPGLQSPNPPHRGSVFRADLTTGAVTYIAGGLRTPDGLVRGPGDQLFITDNQGSWLPASKLVQVEEGDFFGHYNHPLGTPSDFERPDAKPPAVYFPHGDAGTSPTQPVYISAGPYAGQLFVGDLNSGGLRRIALEQVDGTWQGVVLQHSQGLECGVHRLLWGPDGALYVGGIGYPQNGTWNWKGTTFGLQKLVPNGRTAFEISTMRVTPGGFEIEYSRSIPLADLQTPGRYYIEQWRYRSTSDYGGPRTDVQRLAVTSATAYPSRRGVRLDIPGLKPGHVVYVRADQRSDAGEQLWATEAWYTLNKMKGAN